MVNFRHIEREHIILRRAEASACLVHGLNHSAALTACSGIELLLEYLIIQLHEKLSSDSQRRARALRKEIELAERKQDAKTIYWGLRSWVDFYKKRKLFGRLTSQFGYSFQNLNEHTLNTANEIWNKCKHDPYLATRDIAKDTVNLLNAYLRETEILHDGNSELKLTVGAFGKHWLKQWRQPMITKVAEAEDDPRTTILLHLEPFLDLLMRLIDDDGVSFEVKTPLLVAANYVFSSLDLMPENLDSADANSLVDDGAVLAISLYWLLQQDSFDKAVIVRHWPAGASIIEEIAELKRHIWEHQQALFHDSRGQIGYHLVWKAIERIATEGPEALWQNYFREQSAAES